MYMLLAGGFIAAAIKLGAALAVEPSRRRLWAGLAAVSVGYLSTLGHVALTRPLDVFTVFALVVLAVALPGSALVGWKSGLGAQHARDRDATEAARTSGASWARPVARSADPFSRVLGGRRG